MEYEAVWVHFVSAQSDGDSSCPHPLPPFDFHPHFCVGRGGRTRAEGNLLAVRVVEGEPIETRVVGVAPGGHDDQREDETARGGDGLVVLLHADRQRRSEGRAGGRAQPRGRQRRREERARERKTTGRTG